MRSITASHDSPVASVTDTSSNASRNRFPPTRTEAAIQRVADEPAEDAAAAGREIRRRADPQVQQAGRRHQEADDADQAQRRTEVGIAVAIAVHAEQRDPRHDAEHHRQQVGDVAAQIKQNVRQPGTDAAADVVERSGHAARHATSPDPAASRSPDVAIR